jgi:hypothetical protein
MDGLILPLNIHSHIIVSVFDDNTQKHSLTILFGDKPAYKKAHSSPHIVCPYTYTVHAVSSQQLQTNRKCTYFFFWPTFHALSACLDLIRPDFELYATKQQRIQAFPPELSGAWVNAKRPTTTTGTRIVTREEWREIDTATIHSNHAVHAHSTHNTHTPHIRIRMQFSLF